MEPHREKLDDPDPTSSEVTARVVQLIQEMTKEQLAATLYAREPGVPDHCALRAASLRKPRRAARRARE